MRPNATSTPNTDTSKLNPPQFSGYEIRTRAEAERALSIMRDTDLALKSADLERRILEITHLQKLVIPAPLLERIQALTEKLEGSRSCIASWAEKNREIEWPEKSQTLELGAGYLSFHKGQRSVELLAEWARKKNPWNLVAQAMRKVKGLKKYLRLTPAVNKKLILEATSGAKDDSDGPHTKTPKLTAEQLRVVGIRVAQEESFRIDLKPIGLAATLPAAAEKAGATK